MNFAFEHFHFAMDSREKIKMMKDLSLLHADLMEIVISELQSGNVISHVQLFGDNEMEVAFRKPFHKSYEHPNFERAIETALHYRGDFYRREKQAVVAKLPGTAK